VFKSRKFSYKARGDFTMKQNGHRDSQIMEILKEAESGIPVPTLCREHGMSRATFYK